MKVRYNRFKMLTKLPLSNEELCTLISIGYITGLGALVLNGYSYESIEGGLTYVTKAEELHDMLTDCARLVYLPNYNFEIGYEEDPHVASSERMICDFLMYPEELYDYLYLCDALIGYKDEFNWDFSKVREMLIRLGGDESSLDEALERYKNELKYGYDD